MGNSESGRPPLAFGVEEIVDAIQGCNGIVSKVADKLRCSWVTAKKYIEMFEETKEAFYNEEQRAIDMAENKVLKSINLDDVQTAKWFLSKKAKDRGYGDETNLNVKGDKMPCVYILPDGTKIEM